MKKSDREKVFNKYGGRCAYCGDELVKGWHADHIDAVRRYYDGTIPQCNKRLDCVENINPSCASCNINKHGDSIEHFRKLIEGFMKHLNGVNTQYKIAKRYGLVKEEIKPVIFYFESYLRK